MSFTLSIGNDLQEAIDLVQTDRPAGLNALERLALAGDRSAILCLGLYLSENSDSNDQAVPWLTAAAGFGSEDAAWNLAMIARENGDEEAMRQWIDVAADLGEADAVKVRSRGYDVASVLETYR